MNLSFFNKKEKYQQEVNREIQIDILTPQNANKIDELIRFWNNKDDILGLTSLEREPIRIYLNSLGGDLSSAITIMDAINLSKTPVYTFNIGITCKESFLIYIAGHKRFCYPNAIFIYSDSIFEKIEKNENESNFYNYSDMKTSQQNKIKFFILDKTKITEAQYDRYSKNDWYFTADDAFKIHICNEISKNHYYYQKIKNK